MALDSTPFPITPEPPPFGSGAGPLGWMFQTLFLVLALLMVLFHPRTQAFSTFSIIFSAIVLEALPFMLLGTLISGIVEVFVSREHILRLLPGNKLLAISGAAFMGIVFPVCECAIVPVVRKFIHKGMPLGSAVAFLLGGPIVNPLVFGSTYTAYGFSFETAFLRALAGAAIAIAVGAFIDSAITSRDALVSDRHGEGCGCGHADCGHDHHPPGDGTPFSPASLPGKIRAALSHGAYDFYDIGRFLIMGAFIAAALQTLVSRQVFLSITDAPFLSIAAMMGLAVVLNLCSEADAFIAASFQPLGIPFSAQMAFMVLGPMLDIKLILMYLGLFTRKMILTLVLSVTLTVFLAMAALEVSQWFAV